MTDYNMNTMMTNREIAAAVVAAPFQAVARFFRGMVLQTSRTVVLNQLNEISDAKLEALGMTRAEAALRILRN